MEKATFRKETTGSKYGNRLGNAKTHVFPLMLAKIRRGLSHSGLAKLWKKYFDAH